MNDFIDSEADLDSEEDDLVQEEYDSETGGVKRKQVPNGGSGKRKKDYEDSSEEEDDDDDEEAARIREGFIVDDEEEDEELEDGTTVRVSKKGRRKRRRSQRDEDEDDEGLDEEDLDLMLENTGAAGARSNKNKFKRLKQRGREDHRRGRQESRDLEQIFSDDEGEGGGDLDEDGGGRRGGRGLADEFDDFIENDSSDDEGGRGGSEDEMRVTGRARARGGRGVDTENLGLREGAMSDMQDIFGMDDYEDALVTEQETAEMEERTQDLQLKDVFEPSELAERLLTDEDNEIRWKDVPERLQLLRRPFKNLELSQGDELAEVAWIASSLFPRKHLHRSLAQPFNDAIRKVLELFNVENYEVPFVYQQRKDYLIHTVKIPRANPIEGEPPYDLDNTKMLSEKDLWTIMDLDVKFKAFIDKRNNFMKVYNSLRDMGIDEDPIIEDRIRSSDNVDQIQDLHDYFHFKYAAQLKDASTMNGDGRRPTTHRKPGAGRTVYERIRAGKVYTLVHAFGISAKQFALNVQVNKKREFAEDPDRLPEILADDYVDSDFPTGSSALQAAKVMLAEEIFTNPTMKQSMRQRWFTMSLIHVNVTEKGVKQIDEQHQYYEFKYLKNQSLANIASQPSMFLKMIKAEMDGLTRIVVELEDHPRIMRDIYEYIVSDNYSEIADAWNKERKEVVDMAMQKFSTLFAKSLKDELKNACEDEVMQEISEAYSKRLDQAPYKPKGLSLGEVPRVFTLSNGRGEWGKDAIVGVFLDEDGNLMGTVKYDDLKEELNRASLESAIQKHRPDVIGIAGFSVQTHRLYDDVRKLVDEKQLTVADDDNHSSPIEVLYINDEVARLYQNSERAKAEYSDLPPLSRYCCALARYVQSPLLEYAALGKDIVSISFHPAQNLISEEKLKKALDTAMIDIVNLVGVHINEAVKKSYVANLLPFICGLGPRKATTILKTIAANGGKVGNRQELLGISGNRDIVAAVGPKVFENCASFMIIPHEPKDRDSDYFDGTRVHPEEYELGRKMAADAMDFDEEDVADFVGKNGKGAVVNELVKNHIDRLNELILEEYAEELERNFNQRKRATLEAIRGELMSPYEELRGRFQKLTVDEVFTMLTGESRSTLDEGMVVPVNLRRVTDRYISARLDCGVEGNITSDEMPLEAINARPSYYYHVGQTVRAMIVTLSKGTFYAELTLKEDKINSQKRPHLDVVQEEWDDQREERDKARLAVRNQEQTRTARVIKHPLFKPFNSRQAEEFLAGQSRGDAVIRPSSNGPDHIAVTWKVADGIYQHLDVLELDKKNEFTVGRVLRVGQKYSYSDLDELIVNHVKAMARKVDELTHNPKFQPGTKEDAAKWLEKYCEANPKRSSYAFCLDPKQPGYFVLLFKAGAQARMGQWYVKVIPGAFQLNKTVYPDAVTLCNGFKTTHTHMAQAQRGGAGGRPRM